MQAITTDTLSSWRFFSSLRCGVPFFRAASKAPEGGRSPAAGNLDAQVDTKWMYWDVKRHAENLNSIGDGMAAAIDKQLKSERLKTELITNVSHDIKTPLTSIINYVDLFLQHEHTPEQEEEYLAVLKRQAFKLKKAHGGLGRGQQRPRRVTCP